MKSNLVVLINPGHDDDVPEKIAVSYGAKSRKIRRYDPPISIINLGGFIRDNGYDVVLLDTSIEPDYIEILKGLIKEKPLAIGISVILGKFTKNAIALTRLIKEIDGDVPVVWGGKLVPLGGGMILEEDVDFLVYGDGEFTFLDLLESLKKEKDFRDIPGIGYKIGGKLYINKKRDPETNLDDAYISEDFGWKLVNKNINYRQFPYFINLYTSRGCKFNCAFCYLKDIKQYKSKYRFRRRSAENIIKEIDYLNNLYGIDVITFGDDDFLYNVEEIIPVFNFLKERNIYIEHIWTNIHHLKQDVIELLRGTCQTVCYSIETVSPRLQKIINKVVPTKKVIEVNRKLRKAGINTVHNILFGIPTETVKETKMNIDLLKKLKEINPHMRANTYILTPIPDTPIFEFAKKIANKDIEWDLGDLADFHFRYLGRTASKFRPYLAPEDNLFYETVSELTNELFAELNEEPTSSQLKKINNDEKLAYIFGDVYDIARPEDRVRKYILDMVIEAKDAGLPRPEIAPF